MEWERLRKENKGVAVKEDGKENREIMRKSLKGKGKEGLGEGEQGNTVPLLNT